MIDRIVTMHLELRLSTDQTRDHSPLGKGLERRPSDRNDLRVSAKEPRDFRSLTPEENHTVSDGRERTAIDGMLMRYGPLDRTGPQRRG